MDRNDFVRLARDTVLARRIVDLASRALNKFALASSCPVEDLGPMAMKGNVELGPLAPDPTGTGFVQLLFVYPEYKYFTVPESLSRRGHIQSVERPFEIVAVDLQTGRVARTPASHRKGSVGWRVFSWTWGRCGSLYIGTCGPPSHLLSWDPKTQMATDHGRVARGIEAVHSLSVGTDGVVYGGCSNRPFVFSFDPQLRRMKSIGLVGWPRNYVPAYAFSVGSDGSCVYVASGKMPWQVMSYDLRTKRQSVLLTYDPLDFPWIHQYKDAVYASVKFATGPHEQRDRYFRLSDGCAIEVDSLPDVSPSDQDSGRRELRLHDRASILAGARRPTVCLESDVTRTSSHVRVRIAHSTGVPRCVVVPVVTQPWMIANIARTPAGKILGTTLRYGDAFVFDPASGEHETLGRVGKANVYAILSTSNQMYLAGYPHAPLFQYSPSSAWTHVRHSGSDSLEKSHEKSALANPQRLVRFGDQFGVHYVYHLVADGAGRVLAGCRGQRHYAGGALVRYDPATTHVEGIGRPLLSAFPVAGLALTENKRHIVYSSRIIRSHASPSERVQGARLFVFSADDLQLTRVIVPVPGADSTGLVESAHGDLIVGVTAANRGLMSWLYAVDAATGELIYRHKLLGAQGGSFRRGLDGFIWTFVGDVLVRIEPRRGTQHVIGRVEGGRGQFVFIEDDLYLAGTPHLRRIRSVLDHNRAREARSLG